MSLSKRSSHTYQIKRFIVGQMQSNCYLVTDASSCDAVIIDPGDDGEYIIDTVTKLNVRPVGILATHGHFDHVMSGFVLQHLFSIPFSMNTLDQFLLDRMGEHAKHFIGIPRTDPAPSITYPLKHNDVVAHGSISFRALSTPGHTPGSMSIVLEGTQTVFVGDLLFDGGGVGRTDFSYSNRAQLNHSIQTIMELPETTILYPGHGDSTTVGEETMYHRAL